MTEFNARYGYDVYGIDDVFPIRDDYPFALAPEYYVEAGRVKQRDVAILRTQTAYQVKHFLEKYQSYVTFRNARKVVPYLKSYRSFRGQIWAYELSYYPQEEFYGGSAVSLSCNIRPIVNSISEAKDMEVIKYETGGDNPLAEEKYYVSDINVILNAVQRISIKSLVKHCYSAISPIGSGGFYCIFQETLQAEDIQSPLLDLNAWTGVEVTFKKHTIGEEDVDYEIKEIAETVTVKESPDDEAKVLITLTENIGEYNCIRFLEDKGNGENYWDRIAGQEALLTLDEGNPTKAYIGNYVLNGGSFFNAEYYKGLKVLVFNLPEDMADEQYQDGFVMDVSPYHGYMGGNIGTTVQMNNMVEVVGFNSEGSIVWGPSQTMYKSDDIYPILKKQRVTAAQFVENVHGVRVRALPKFTFSS